MNKKTLEYAKANIDIIERENNIKTFISQNKLYIETIFGRNFELSEEEIKYILTELRSISISSEFDFTFVCQNEECSDLNTLKLKSL